MDAKKSFKICCIATLVILVIFIVILVILYFTILKPKQPEVVAKPLGLSNFHFSLQPNVSLSLSIRMQISIKNPNYARFEYGNSTAYLYYFGSSVGDAPIGAGVIHARSTANLTTVVNVAADKVISNPNFLPDVFRGSLSLTTASTMEGKVVLLGIFRLHAKDHIACMTSVFVWKGNSSSSCSSEIKL
ncbi:hypothetical protein HPP92_013673 [Vanilla planifolia]|uniref:Late embryogenesis abundant protein LEA-2 subgroup domain-containing protein n=1 Tax=Vanilla planifolia TaxID=51239 RepID=A0A835QUH4_VANPL|nr:hypothetical protein HPP92_013673 [Vanilla planifolia]